MVFIMKIETIRNPDRIFNYWKKQKGIVFAIIVFGLSFNILTALAPVWQGKLIDAIVDGIPFRDLISVALSFLALVTGIQVLRYFKRYFIRRFANSTGASMRFMIYRNILGRPVTELEGESAGNLMTRAISDVDLCVEGMRKFTTELFDTGVLLASYIATLLVFDVRITLLSSVCVPLAMLLAEKLKGLIYRYTADWRKKNSEIADFTWNSIDNLMLYRVKGLEGDIAARYVMELDDLSRKAVRAGVMENSMQPVYNIIAMLGVILVITLGGRMVFSGSWTVGQFSSYMTIYAAMAVKASKASKLFNSVQKSQVSWKRIKPYLRDKLPRIDSGARDSAETEDLTGTIERTVKIERAGTRSSAGLPRADVPLLSVRNISLRHANALTDAISGITFEGRKGAIIGVTGPVACGKSSLGLALTGLYPYGGSVLIEGRELSLMTEGERARLVSYQGHRSELLSDTIYANITLGVEGDVSAVLGDVSFDADLARMADGTETRVGNGGVRLSGGQQARIALARALYGKKKLIILDDPFSAVDVKTEEEIIGNIRSHYPESLIILISHRLTVFPKADSIVLLRADHTAEYGTHESLMRDSSLYREIYSLQRAAGGEQHEE